MVFSSPQCNNFSLVNVLSIFFSLVDLSHIWMDRSPTHVVLSMYLMTDAKLSV